jgi:5-deoxy-glucuronate isomerase
MNLKKTYTEKHGYERVVTDRNSPLVYAECDMLKLEAGETYTVDEPGKEFVLIVLYGKCEVFGADFHFSEVGCRESVFDGAAESAYVGKDTPFTVRATCTVKIAVCKAPAERYYAPYRIKQSEVAVKTFGKGSFVREVAFTFPESGEANHLYIGEFWVEDGKWGSYPPHKHDVDDLPREGALDEIYYYEFDKPQGFGFQAVYTEEKDINEVYKVENGDFVVIPKGYHPFTVAPGYKNYCLWIMAGKERGLLSSSEECHKWIVAK